MYTLGTSTNRQARAEKNALTVYLHTHTRMYAFIHAYRDETGGGLDRQAWTRAGMWRYIHFEYAYKDSYGVRTRIVCVYTDSLCARSPIPLPDPPTLLLLPLSSILSPASPHQTQCSFSRHVLVCVPPPSSLHPSLPPSLPPMNTHLPSIFISNCSSTNLFCSDNCTRAVYLFLYLLLDPRWAGVVSVSTPASASASALEEKEEDIHCGKRCSAALWGRRRERELLFARRRPPSVLLLAICTTDRTRMLIMVCLCGIRIYRRVELFCLPESFSYRDSPLWGWIVKRSV